MTLKGFLTAVLTASVLLLHGCVVQQWQGAGIDRYLQDHSLGDTLVELESQTPSKQDRPIYLLNRGLLYHLVGNYQQSNVDLEAAKFALEQVQALSVTQGVASSSINETFNDYSATPSERVLLHVVMALNYLALQELDSARVEMLQADVRMRQIDDDEAQLASARFVAGLVFELNREWSDAMISYRKAEQLLTQRSQAIPRVLQRRLLVGSRMLGLESEYQQYLTQFTPVPALPEGHGEVLVLFFDGKVSSMQQRRVSVYVPSLEHYVSIAQPFYPPRQRSVMTGSLALGADAVELELLEDVEQLARDALQSSQPKRLALSLVRATTKHQLVKNSRQKDPLVGMLADLASILTEVADTRSWSLLPASFQVGAVQLPAGHYSQSVDIRMETDVEVKAGSTQLLIGNSYGTLTALTYP